MSEIVANVTRFIRNTLRAVATTTHRVPWLVPAAILAMFLVLP
jgi:hypothetical protein